MSGSTPSSALRTETAVSGLLERYRAVRAFTTELCAPLTPEDCVLQSMEDASPVRWHLAHTTWFFETFCLRASQPAYEEFSPAFTYLFNSYYNTVGDQFPRPRRGLLSRPSVAEIFSYRRHVDAALDALLGGDDAAPDPSLLAVVELGIHHEQQHQELILTDIKHAFSQNPIHPVYADAKPGAPSAALPLEWIAYDEGLRSIGSAGDTFSYDNEEPRHRVFLGRFRLASRLVTNAEYLAFVRDGGYDRAELWLSDGWLRVRDGGWRAPLYWSERDGRWWSYGLSGLDALVPSEPVCHVSYFEADAYARWAGARLPTEAEWEVAAEAIPVAGNFVESGCLRPCPAPASHPAPADGAAAPAQMFGDVWEWTASPYTPYPGYRPAEGALGEYNGKFMCSQQVLRGGSCATPRRHVRPSYRNFFPPGARWQFAGIRLAR